AVRAEAAIAAAGLPTRMDAVAKTPFAAEALVRHMGQDKKAQGGKLTFILARALGDTFVAKDVTARAVRDFLVSEGARP
ncbi:MAG: 3-dehydroquinate synthase, partial [Phenylobacterium sp.]|nr:3-dehydroquinate synthase [Phenylobacterium sp.]